MKSTEDDRRVRFWRPDFPSIAGMLRVEREDRVKTTYSEHFSVVVVYEGAVEGWYRGAVRTHVAGAIKLKEPGEVHRGIRVLSPLTLQGAWFSQEVVAAAAAALGLRGPVHFKAPSFGVGERATRLAFALHAALVRDDAPEIERSTLVAEMLGEILSTSPVLTRAGERTSRAVRLARAFLHEEIAEGERTSRAVRLARAFLHEEIADKITLDALADHAGLDKFHLVRAFRAAVGLPPYEYLTHVRVSKAKELLQRGALVAEAAQAVGFYDESQLHRHFRRIVGIPPGAYARSFLSSERRGQHR